MKTLTVNTKLIGRADTFKVVAVAHASGYPILLVGPPGTGKTEVVLDFARALNPGIDILTSDVVFILETDEGTRSAEVKGRVDLQQLVQHKTYTVNSPVTKAKHIIINEVDKASAGLRNAMLSIMNEKVLFNGHEKVHCPWESFTGTCNKIPEDEEGNHFWDRYVFKHKVSRLNRNQLAKFYKANGQSALQFNIPEQGDIDIMTSKIPADKLEIFVDVCYDSLSDRSMTYIPRIVSAVSVVYGINLTKAMVKTAFLMTPYSVYKDFSSKIEAPEIVNIRSKIEAIISMTDYDQISRAIDEIKNDAQAASKNPDIAKSDFEELAQELKIALSANPVWTVDKKSAIQEAEEESAQAGAQQATISQGTTGSAI